MNNERSETEKLVAALQLAAEDLWTREIQSLEWSMRPLLATKREEWVSRKIAEWLTRAGFK